MIRPLALALATAVACTARLPAEPMFDPHVVVIVFADGSVEREPATSLATCQVLRQALSGMIGSMLGVDPATPGRMITDIRCERGNIFGRDMGRIYGPAGIPYVGGWWYGRD